MRATEISLQAVRKFAQNLPITNWIVLYQKLISQRHDSFSPKDYQLEAEELQSRESESWFAQQPAPQRIPQYMRKSQFTVTTVTLFPIAVWDFMSLLSRASLVADVTRSPGTAVVLQYSRGLLRLGSRTRAVVRTSMQR
jgi:hypothetical protein